MHKTIICEIGSCHRGRAESAAKAVEEIIGLQQRCDSAKVQLAIKFQLFPNDTKFVGSGNIWLDPAVFDGLVEKYGAEIPIFASTFSPDCLEVVLKNKGVHWVKFAFSRQGDYEGIQRVLAAKKIAWVSTDMLSARTIRKRFNKHPLLKLMFCIPEYPVVYPITFGHWLTEFDGFSDHTLGIKQTREAMAFVNVVEKHLRPNDCPADACPDATFAITMKELEELCLRTRF